MAYTQAVAFFIFTIVPLLTCSASCARFKFPDLTDNLTVTAHEQTAVSIEFQLTFDDGCTREKVFALVSGEKSSSYHDDYCIVLIKRENGQCQSFSEGRCSCQDGGEGKVVFTKTVGREDDGKWVWWIRDDAASKTIVEFNILDAVAETSPSQDEEVPLTTLSYPEAHDNSKMGETVTKLEENSNPADRKNIDNVTNGDNLDGDDVKRDAHGDDDNSATSATVAAAPVNVSHVGAIVAAVNVSTIVVIGVVIVVARVIYAKLGRRPRRAASPPPPCSLDRTSSMRRRQEMFGSVHYAPFDKTRSSTSSRIYDEIPAVPVAAASVDTPPAAVSVPVLAPVRLDNVATEDTSIYLTPVVSHRDRLLP